ncbi:MAG: D-alanyl-D-alanine carboxypeptidase [Cyanobacteria bacterium P01_G01_bin.39]
MLDFIAGIIVTSWFGIHRQPQPELKPMELLPWSTTAIFELPRLNRDRHSSQKIVSYLENLTDQGFEGNRQGIWVQSDWTVLGSNSGQTALPAASLTKVATTLAALDKWGVQHQFLTDIYLVGKLNDGIVEGDLIIQGSGDPFFVWEEAIALGNALNQLGIRKIQGDLLIIDKFYMNYQDQSLAAGELFKQAIDQTQWQREVRQQHDQMPAGTMAPQVAIAGKVKTINHLSEQAQLLIRHRSLPLGEILKQMNLYSNNQMAQMLTDLVGGAVKLALVGQEVAGVEPSEIELVNGSGLGESNRISPRAVCQMLITIERLLHSSAWSTADLFPTAGRDTVGTVQARSLPPGTILKTGTLDRVSALAGVIPTGDRGNVYFSIINYGNQVERFRQQQDILLNDLVQSWQLIPNNLSVATKYNWYLGDPQRNSLNIEH